MRRLTTFATCGVLALGLSACDLGGGGDRERVVVPVDISGISAFADGRLPQGFTLANGRGGIRDLSVDATPNRSTVVAFATIAPPRAITAYYRREAEAAGMTYAGQMDAGDMLATNFRRADPYPRTFSVNASQRGAFTNVTLVFDLGR